MELGTGFDVVRRHKWVWLLPAALSLAGLLISLFIGLVPVVKPGIHFKFVVPNGMPSLDSILQLEQSDIGVALSPSLLIFSLFTMAISAFLAGGWLSGVFGAIKGQSLTTQEEFMQRARYFFGRLLAARLLAFFGMIIGVLAVAMILGPLAVLLMLAALVLTFFWELAIVREDLSVSDGFTRGYQLLRAHLGEVFGVALPIALMSGCISVFANLMAQSMIGYVLLIPIWAFIGGGFGVAICALYDRLVSGQIPPSLEQL